MSSVTTLRDERGKASIGEGEGEMAN
jgi:hypothetical protein